MVADDAKKGIIPIRLVHQAKRSDRWRSSGGSKVTKTRKVATDKGTPEAQCPDSVGCTEVQMGGTRLISWQSSTSGV